MTNDAPLRAELPADFDLDKVEWIRLTGSPQFDYPIDYYFAVLHADPATGRLDLLTKWEPNCYCHFHRHVCKTVALVIDGEQHVIETRAKEVIHKIRQPGFTGLTPDNETHMERAGPNGCVMLFAMQTDDGRMFEVLDKNGSVIVTATLEDFVSGRLTRSKAA